MEMGIRKKSALEEMRKFFVMQKKEENLNGAI
jgi:hypothetical protein